MYLLDVVCVPAGCVCTCWMCVYLLDVVCVPAGCVHWPQLCVYLLDVGVLVHL